MRPGQEAIHYISGGEPDTLRRSPHLEGYGAKGVEVLLLPDAIDDFWIPAVGSFEDKPFRSITRGAAELDRIEADRKRVVKGTSVSVRVDHGGRRIIKKKQ